MKKSWSLFAATAWKTANAPSSPAATRAGNENPSPGPSPKRGGETEPVSPPAPPSFSGKGVGGSGSEASATELLRQEEGGRAAQVLDDRVPERGPDRPVHDPVV